MQLFAPDDLSRPRRSAVVALAEEARAVSSLLSSHFPALPPTSEVLVVPSLNPVTRNYIVLAGSERHVVKRRGAGASIDMLREAELGRQLGSRGVPVPRSIASAGGAAAIEQDGFAWSVQAFLSGGPFTGDGREIEAAARMFVRLVEALSDVPAHFLKPETVDGSTLDELPTLVSEARQTLPPDSLEALLRWRQTLDRAIAAAQLACDTVMGTLAPLHLDYHPLNLLVEAGEVVAVLDLEDIAVYPLQAGHGFAAYKLLRRRAVDAPEEVSALAARWLANLGPGYAGLAAGPEVLAAGARHRVLALIRLILHRHLRQHDSSLLYDLPKHLKSLREIEELFERGKYEIRH